MHVSWNSAATNLSIPVKFLTQSADSTKQEKTKKKLFGQIHTKLDW